MQTCPKTVSYTHLVHTGDFKIDYTPVFGERIDLQRFAELGKKGVLALMCDSTNAERPGFTQSRQMCIRDRLGIEGIEIEDKIPLTEEEKKQMFIDILPELGPDDGVAYVSFYIEPENDSDDTIRKVLDAVHELKDFVDIGEGTIVKTQTADEDWMNNWKKYWKPFQVDDKIWIKPTWETCLLYASRCV